jgi:hypothetical protein
MQFERKLTICYSSCKLDLDVVQRGRDGEMKKKLRCPGYRDRFCIHQSGMQKEEEKGRRGNSCNISNTKGEVVKGPQQG